jgi:hypothetical protein
LIFLSQIATLIYEHTAFIINSCYSLNDFKYVSMPVNDFMFEVVAGFAVCLSACHSVKHNSNLDVDPE